MCFCVGVGVYVCTHMSLFICVPRACSAHAGQKRMLDPLGTGVTGGCKLLDMDAGNERRQGRKTVIGLGKN